MDSMKCKVRFEVIIPCSTDLPNVDAWTVDGDREYAKRTVIKLAYKYMGQVVNDALYDPVYRVTPSNGCASMYVRDYYLYSRKRMVN